jgi:hypothetical protein
VVARVGGAFHQAQVALPQVELYNPDQSHPSNEGTLLAACTIAHALLGVAVRVPDPPPLGVPRDTAERLCAIGNDVRCLEGGDLCEGTCFALQRDPRHCGTCARTCGAEEPCQKGICGCPSGQTACNGTCRALASDMNNCGACGKTCAAGEACVGGACACNAFAMVPGTFASLAAVDPACSAAAPATCVRAAELACVARGCSNSGFGPTTGHSPVHNTLICLPQHPVEVSYTDLASFDAACGDVTARDTQACASAAHRFCGAQGKVSGFASFSPGGGRVTCLAAPAAAGPGAMLVSVSEADLAGFASRCVPHPVSCNTAAWSLCRSFGFGAGFGPVEASGTLRTVACVK